MRRRLLLSGLFLVAGALQAQVQEPAPASAPATAEARTVAGAPPTATVRMQTALGAIVIAIDSARAPLTAANFLRYVDQRRFDHSAFYRAMKVGDTGAAGLVQGGLRGDPHRVLKPIAHEPTSVTGLSHVSGAISMARTAPGTASGDFFIVVGDLLALDAHGAYAATGQAADPGYAVFGHVVDGMDVVRAILAQPVSATAQVAVMKGQMIAQPVAIVSVRRIAATCGGSPCRPGE